MRFKSGIVVISGPSGVGKSTVCNALVERLDNVYLSVSVTSRCKSAGEEQGREYFFISKDEFNKRIEQGGFLEWAEVFGNFYGTPKDKVDEALAAGQLAILEIDVQGACQVKQLCPEALMIFILPPQQADLAARMSGRGRGEGKEAKLKRLNGADREISEARKFYDYMVINDKLDEAIEKIMSIINRR